MTRAVKSKPYTEVPDQTPSDTVAQIVPVIFLAAFRTFPNPPPRPITRARRVSTTEDVCFLCKEGGNLVECDEGTSWYRRVKSKRESLGKPPLLPGTAFSCLGVPMEEAEGQEEEEEGGGGEEEDDAKSKKGCKLVRRKGKAKKQAQKPRCKKVYHAYCMGFNVADDELSSCPRHVCVDCAAIATYFCRYGAGWQGV